MMSTAAAAYPRITPKGCILSSRALDSLMSSTAAAPIPPKVALEPLAPVVVDFAPSEPEENWFVSGLEEEVKTELLRFHTLEVARKIDPGRCPGRDTGCLVEGYRAAGVQLPVLAPVDGALELTIDALASL